MEVVVSARETIKPSSPTPQHLRSFKLSLIDQHQPPTLYTRILLFYSAHGDVDRFQNTNMSDRLKKSLSATLTEFYPAAGRVDSSLSIDCNDDGLEYFEARVRGPLHQVLCSPKAEELDQLLPYDVYNYGSGFGGLSAVQVSIFDCGGIAIGVSISHVVADAASLGTFVDRWAAIAGGAPNEVVPMGFAPLLPPREDYTVPFIPKEGSDVKLRTPTKRFVTSKRFVFDAAKIAALKAMCGEKSNIKSPTRVEVLLALIYRCLIKVAKSRSVKSTSLLVAINLRGRVSPPLPQNSFGNLLMSALLPPLTTETVPELQFLVEQLRELVKKIDGDYLKTLQANNAILFFNHINQVNEQIKEGFMRQDFNCILSTSWCRFPFYRADFGWGTPTWVTQVNLNFVNYVTLMDTKNGDGIEAWVSLTDQDMARFESEEELLAFASANPMVYESTTDA